MPKGFFSSTELQSKKPAPKIARCGTCGLYKDCLSPKMPATGKGRKNILIVAEAPGKEEDARNTQLVGKAGQRLRQVLRKLGVDLDKDCIKTNAVICRPPDNETPENDQIVACRPNLLKTIQKNNPNVIILLGGTAVQSLLDDVWKEGAGTIGRWAGFCIPCQKPNAWIVPTYHPSYLERKSNKALDRLFKEHLKLAISQCRVKPWAEPPKYKEQIEIIARPSKAAKIIREMERRGGPCAFDYEGTCLKPEWPGAEIVSCSVCWKGKKTIAFPWEREAIDAMDSFLKTKNTSKIASNIKFEDRWTRAKLGHPVRNWLWDTMLAAHVLDSRKGITSIKFQSFILLGADAYDEHIRKYLTNSKGHLNRIKELNLKDLLLYNGLDSLLEYLVAEKQMKAFRKKG